MDREQDQQVVVCERCGRAAAGLQASPESLEQEVETGPVKPPLLEVTTPSGRVWYLVNLN